MKADQSLGNLNLLKKNADPSSHYNIRALDGLSSDSDSENFQHGEPKKDLNAYSTARYESVQIKPLEDDRSMMNMMQLGGEAWNQKANTSYVDLSKNRSPRVERQGVRYANKNSTQ